MLLHQLFFKNTLSVRYHALKYILFIEVLTIYSIHEANDSFFHCRYAVKKFIKLKDSAVEVIYVIHWCLFFIF